MNRPLSMTGFGRGESSGCGKNWTIELRSVNHRYLDIKIRIPRQYSFLEEKVKVEVSKFYARGHLDIFFDIAEEGTAGGRLKVDIPLAREYYNCLYALQEELPLEGKPDLNMLAGLRDLITPANDDIFDKNDEIWTAVKPALFAALTESTQMRVKEGQALKKDLFDRMLKFKETVKKVEHAVPDLIKKREESLNQRLETLLKGVDIDPARLSQEAAILVDKTDISEEIVRLFSHIEQFNKFLSLDEPIGRRMDFLLQEFLRELNTIASKINDAEMSYIIVDLKNELEKFREQIQNLE